MTLEFDGEMFSGVIDLECASPPESLRTKSPSKTSGIDSEETVAGVPPRLC